MSCITEAILSPRTFQSVAFQSRNKLVKYRYNIMSGLVLRLLVSSVHKYAYINKLNYVLLSK